MISDLDVDNMSSTQNNTLIEENSSSDDDDNISDPESSEDDAEEDDAEDDDAEDDDAEDDDAEDDLPQNQKQKHPKPNYTKHFNPFKKKPAQNTNVNVNYKGKNYDPNYKYKHPTQNGGKPELSRSKIQNLIKKNPCADAFATEEECNRSEFCQWDTESESCKSLGIDYSVRKMAVMRAKLNQRFLDMLQIAAIDCLVFRELHLSLIHI